MSAFLCLAVKGRMLTAERLAAYLPRSLSLLEDVTRLPIGQAALGGNNGVAVLVDVLDQMRHHKHGGHREAFLQGLAFMMRDVESVAVLKWWGRSFTDEIEATAKQKLSIQEFEQLFPDLEEGVRYVLIDLDFTAPPLEDD